MKRKALVIGVNEYKGNILCPQFSLKDAEAIAQLLRTIGQFDEVQVLINGLDQIDRRKYETKDITNLISQLFNPQQQDTGIALLYFSGNGAGIYGSESSATQQGDLLLTDFPEPLVKPSSESRTRSISLQWLRDQLEKGSVKQQIVWLDSDFSYRFIELFPESPVGSRYDRCFIAAKPSYGGIAEEGSTHGVLTDALLQCLNPVNQVNNLITNYTLADFLIKIFGWQENLIKNTGSPIALMNALEVFYSVAALRAAHTQLLKQQQSQPENSPELLDAIEQFVQQGRARGAWIDGDDDRWACQSLLDSWSTLLYRAGRPIVDASLAEFDPSLLPTLDDSLCPYLGLDAFRENNHDRFFGRQKLVESLIHHLKDHRLLAVVGSSGSGKSSVVMGGLLPRLKAGALPDSQTWHYYPPIVPGSNPLLALARRLQPPEEASEEWLQAQVQQLLQDHKTLLNLIDQSGVGTVVLCIDQFEEVFPSEGDTEIQSAFVQNLLQLVQAPDAEHRVILTMRIDYEDSVAKILGFRDPFAQARIQATPLESGELREAIEKPAELVGLKFEDRVVDELIKDALGEPAALPLLQFTLLKLWGKRDRNRITWAAYQNLGGGRKALTRSADEFYNSLIPQQQETAKRILLSMVKPKEGVEFVSKRIPRQDLYRSGEARDQVDAVLLKLVQARLVRLTEGNAPNEAQVEVAHEALIRNWDSLKNWLKEERETHHQRIRLMGKAEEWRAHDKDAKLALRGSLLEEAQEYSDLDDLTREFLQFSIVAEQAEAEAERKQWEAEAEQKQGEERLRLEQKWRKRITTLAVEAVVILSGFTAWALWEKAQAVKAKDQAVKTQAQAEKAKAQAEKAKAQAEKAQAQAVNAKDQAVSTCRQLSGKDANDTLALEYEQKGFQSLLASGLEQAKNEFDQAYEASPCYHNVFEIHELLQKNVDEYRDANPSRKGEILRYIYQTIVNKYSWGARPEVLIQMRNRPKVSLEYFPKKQDPPLIQMVLSNQFTALGFTATTLRSERQEPTNNISFGQEVDINTIKLVAMTLIQQPGVKITVIDPFQGLSPDREKELAYKLQIGTDPKGFNCQPWTVEAIQKATEFKGCWLP